jgi:hypothetical protein
MLKGFLNLKTNLGEKSKNKKAYPSFGPDRRDRPDELMARHDPHNADWAMPRPRLKPSGSAWHDPFHYRVMPGLRVGRHEPGQARVRSARPERLQYMFRLQTYTTYNYPNKKIVALL